MIISTNEVTPVEVSKFFEEFCKCEPEVNLVKKTKVYSVPGYGVSITTDPYRGCHIDIKEIDSKLVILLKGAIGKLFASCKASCAFDSIWVDVSLPFNANIFSILPESFEIGKLGKSDLIYDYQQKKIRVWEWINPNKECSIPPGATHNIGATALLIDKTAKKVLLVVNVCRDDAWNLPGGSFDPVKDNTPSYTALREAQEEGGFNIENDLIPEPKLIGQMEFGQNQFAPAINQIWAYLIDGISQKKLNPPSDEIKRAVWVDFNEIINGGGTVDGLKLSPEIEVPLIAAINGLGCQKIVSNDWMTVHSAKFAPVEDALDATRAAVAQGIVPSEDVALLRAVESLDNLNLSGDEAVGASIIRRAVFARATEIANNCGPQGNSIAEKFSPEY